MVYEEVRPSSILHTKVMASVAPQSHLFTEKIVHAFLLLSYWFSKCKLSEVLHIVKQDSVGRWDTHRSLLYFLGFSDDLFFKNVAILLFCLQNCKLRATAEKPVALCLWPVGPN